MQFMGWDWSALQACPADYIPVIVEVARKDEAERKLKARPRRS